MFATVVEVEGKGGGFPIYRIYIGKGEDHEGGAAGGEGLGGTVFFEDCFFAGAGAVYDGKALCGAIVEEIEDVLDGFFVEDEHDIFAKRVGAGPACVVAQLGRVLCESLLESRHTALPDGGELAEMIVCFFAGDFSAVIFRSCHDVCGF